MQMRVLGNTGLLVSKFCMGAWTFGKDKFGLGGLDGAQSKAIVDRVLDEGINFFDTSNNYSFGQSEELLGAALAGKRQQVVISTKVRSPTGEGPNDQGLSRHQLIRSVEQSLQRLQTDYIDVLIIHGWDELTPPRETLRAMDDLVRNGKVRYIGASNLAAWQLAEFLAISEREGLARFEMLQAYYNLVGRELEHELIPLCEYKKVGIMTWSPLCNGYLTGKYRHGGKGRRDIPMFSNFPPVNVDQGEKVLDQLEAIAADHQTSCGAVALAWQLANPAITCPILGAKTVEQLEQNLPAATLELSAEALASLDEVSAIAAPYPNWMVNFQNQPRLD
ncbi:MAG: aldo/keto reductase [Immundisolibacteraceae bacterium]|nr:aldo/keto reductase [Immundisolibacteraceae bacterium]